MPFERFEVEGDFPDEFIESIHFRPQPPNNVEENVLGNVLITEPAGYPVPCTFCNKRIGSKEKYVVVNKVYVHISCYETTFKCGVCSTTWEPRDRNSFVVWGAQRTYDTQEVCVECDSIHGASCGFCLKRSDVNYGRFLVDDNDNEQWDCFECITDCYSCGNYVLRSKAMIDEQTDTIFCLDCFRRRRVIRTHDFNPMSILKFSGTPKNGLYFGVELEVESENGEAIDHAEVICKKLGYFACIKHDGSLVNGFEIVTCPASLPEQFNFWDKYFDLELPLQSYESPRCGMHVHMSRSAISPAHLARMMVFTYSTKNRSLIETVAGRNLHAGWGERYAEINSAKRITDIVGVEGGPFYAKTNKRDYERDRYGDPFSPLVIKDTTLRPVSQRKIYKKRTRYGRYTALNDTNDQTVELRIFRGCNKRTTVFKNLEFCQAIVDYCRPGQSSFIKLEDPIAFAQFVTKHRHEFRYLHEFLVRRKLVV